MYDSKVVATFGNTQLIVGKKGFTLEVDGSWMVDASLFAEDGGVRLRKAPMNNDKAYFVENPEKDTSYDEHFVLVGIESPQAKLREINKKLAELELQKDELERQIENNDDD